MNTKVYNALKNGKALLVYTKNDGTKRKAIGTLNADVIARRKRSVTVGQIVDAVARNVYFDLEMNGWRTLSADTKVVG